MNNRARVGRGGSVSLTIRFRDLDYLGFRELFALSHEQLKPLGASALSGFFRALTQIH